MTTTVKCKAKNPATCRIHGTISPASLLNQPAQVAKEIERATQEIYKSNNFDEILEARANLEKNQEIYNATNEGLTKLWQNTIHARPSDKVEAQFALEKSLQYRKELLEKHEVLQPCYKQYNDIIAHAVQSHKITNSESLREAVQNLKDLPYGTPVAIKTKTGNIYYDQTGDGFDVEVKRRKPTTGFIRDAKRLLKDEHLDSYNVDISLANSNTYVPMSTVEEIHVLDHNPVPGLTTPKGVTVEGKQDKGMYAVQGDNYFYLMEARSDKHVPATEKTPAIQYWEQDGIALTLLKPRNVRRITRVNL